MSYLISIYLQTGEDYLKFQKYSLALWLVSILCAAFALDFFGIIKKGFRELSTIILPRDKESFIALSVLVSAITIRLIFLNSYPYHPNFDALRDSGLNVQRMLSDEKASLFGYGDYNGYNLHTALVCCVSYLFFGPSILTYSFVAAIVSCLNLLVVFLIVSKLENKKTATWATLILGTMPLHLFYGRTEAIVSFTCLWSALLFGLLVRALERKTVSSYALLGLFCGISMEFYSGVRGLVVILVFIVAAYLIFWIKAAADLKKSFITIAALVSLLLIGLGPQLMYMKWVIFFPPHRIPLASNYDVITENTLNAYTYIYSLANDYWKSLMVYMYEYTRGHYTNGPILNKSSSVFFLLGLVAMFLSQRIQYLMLVLLLLIIPLTHSAFTDTTNMDNRISPTYSLVPIVAAYGIGVFFNTMRSEKIIVKIFNFVFCIVLICESVFYAYDFFVNERMTHTVGLEELRASRMIRLAADNQILPKLDGTTDRKKMCVYSSEKNFKYLDFMQYRQMSEFLFRDYRFLYRITDALAENEIAFSDQCDQPFDLAMLKSKTFCKDRKKFICEAKIKDPITIYYQ